MTAGSLSRSRATEEIRPPRDPRSDEGLFFEIVGWWGPVLLMLAPGAAVVYFGFNGGGFFPGAPAFVAMLLVQVLALRVLLADHPFAGFGRALGIVVVAMSLYAAWTLASGLWSHSTSRALVEFDRALLYLLTLVVFGSLARSPENVRWLIRGLAVGLFVVCGAGLVTRVLPHVWPISPNVANNRLSFPVSYWNTLGLMAAFGVVLCVHLTSSLAESRTIKALGAAAVPVFAAALYFTLSRGSIAALVVGLVAYLAIARPRALTSGFLAAVPPTALAVVVAYGAEKLASLHPTTPGAVAQGHRVAAVVAISVLAAGAGRLLLLRLDRRLEKGPLLNRRPPTGMRLGAAGAAGAVVIALIAAGLPGTVSRQWHTFMSGKAIVIANGDLRQRLTDPSNNGRTFLWRAALHGFSDDPFRGRGSGTYVWQWDRLRPSIDRDLDAHSLYVENLDELGVIGLGLLLVTISTALAVLGSRRRPRSTYGVLFAIALMWALHAGVDWDWEMPAVTFPFFAIVAVSLARPWPSARAAPYVPGRRVPLALAVLAMASAPVLILISQNRLQTSVRAFEHGDCRTATREALSSIDVLAVRPQPYEIIGYCDLQDGYPDQAVTAMQKAVSRDPGLWEYRAGLAIAQGAAGSDPRPAAAAALSQDPREPFAQSVASAFRNAPSARWQSVADVQRRWMTQSGILALP